MSLLARKRRGAAALAATLAPGAAEGLGSVAAAAAAAAAAVAAGAAGASAAAARAAAADSRSAPVELGYDAAPDDSRRSRRRVNAAGASAAAPAPPVSPGRRAPTFAASPTATAALAAELGAAAAADAGAGGGAATGSWRPHRRWTQQLANIEAMRATRDAPVDTMGCDRCADPTAPPPVRRYQILLSLMLSSQTKDEVTFAAMQRLLTVGARADGGGGCTPSAIAALAPSALADLLKPVSFHNNKAKHVLAATAALLARHGGDIPGDAAGLLALPGVGPKMAHLALGAAWGRHDGLGVDVHVHRIANRLGWVPSPPTAGPEATRAALEGWLPRDRWPTFNATLVGFGQQTCTAVAPRCDVCLNRDTCPSSSASLAAVAGAARAPVAAPATVAAAEAAAAEAAAAAAAAAAGARRRG